MHSTSTAVEIDVSTKWNTFTDFREKSFSFCETVFSVSTNDENWMKGQCDCRRYYKLFTCEHVIGIALRKKWTEAPPEAKVHEIGKKRKRGRPRKARAALVIDSDDD